MTVNPKITDLAHQLGTLLKLYCPNAGEGHVAVELMGAIQKGLAESSLFAQIDLPVIKLGAPFDIDSDIDSPTRVTINVTPSRVAVTNEAWKPTAHDYMHCDILYHPRCDFTFVETGMELRVNHSDPSRNPTIVKVG